LPRSMSICIVVLMSRKFNSTAHRQEYTDPRASLTAYLESVKDLLKNNLYILMA